MDSPLYKGIETEYYNYEQASRLIRDYFDHHQLNKKEWAKNYDVEYSSLISIMNKSSSNQLPGTLKKVLEAMGYKVRPEKQTLFFLERPLRS